MIERKTFEFFLLYFDEISYSSNVRRDVLAGSFKLNEIGIADEVLGSRTYNPRAIESFQKF